MRTSLPNFFRLFISLFLFLSALLSSSEAFATLNFPDWMVEQSKKFVEDLKKQAQNLTQSDIHRSKQLIEEAKENKQWTVVVTEYGRMLGYEPQNRKGWLELSLADRKLKQTENNWRANEEAKIAALVAYQLAKNPEEQAEALLVLGSNLDPENMYESPSFLDVYKEIRALTDLDKLRSAHPEWSDLMPFQYIKTEINNQTTPPSACIIFSFPLKTEGIRYEDYVNVTPKEDAILRVTGRQLCLTPVHYGNNYDVILKPGLPNEFGDKLQAETKFSFKVKDQSSRLSFSSRAYVLMRDETPVVPITSVNVDSAKIRILKVSDRALNQVTQNGDPFLASLWEYRVDQIQNNIGELLFEGALELGGEKNKTTTKQIPFSKVVKNITPGVYIVYAEELNSLFGEKARASQWVVVSDLGLTTFTESDGGITVNIRSLKTAEPLQNVEVQLLAYNNTILGKVKTNKDGIAVFEAALTRGKGGNRPLWVLAYGPKEEFSLINLEQTAFDLGDRAQGGRKASQSLDAFLYTEQGVYRPGDTVHISALLRDDKAKAKGQLPLTFKILRPDEVQVASHVLTGSDLGYYELPFALSSSTRTGQWTVLAYADPKKDPIGRVNFAVQDFVPSRVLVQLKANETYLELQKPVDVQIKAQYLFGANAAGLTGTAVYTLKENPNPYPEFPGFYFGQANESFMETRTNLPLLPLDNEGKGNVKLTLDAAPNTSKSLEAVLRVTLADNGGRPEMGTLKLPVYFRPFAIGIKPLFAEGVLPESETKAEFEYMTVGPTKALASAQNLEYTLYRELLHYTWYQPQKYQAWQYRAEVEDTFMNHGIVNATSFGISRLKLDIRETGQYRLEIRDPKTGAATSVRFTKGWTEVAGGEETPYQLKMKAEKDKVKPGETIQLFIKAPFAGQALFTIANDKILETRNIKLSEDGVKVNVTAKEEWGTGVYCLVSAFRPLSKENLEAKPFLPKRAVGVVWLGIDPSLRSLTVDITTPKEIRPQNRVEIPIRVQNENGGTPSKAFITLAAVDEGILKLTDFATPDPVQYFLGQRELSIQYRDLYGKLIDMLPGPLGELRSGGDGGMLSRNMQALSKRSFKIVSLYKGLVELDKDGQAKVSLDIPDFNGNLRIMAVAFDTTRIGKNAASLLVRDPVVLEGTLPRFLAPQDESFLTVSLFNVSGNAGEYQVSVEASGEVETTGDTPKRISLEKGATHSFQLPIKAKKTGDGKFKVRLQGKDLDITREFEISVRSPFAYSLKTESRWLKPSEKENVKEDIMQGFLPETTEVQVDFSSVLPWDVESIYAELKKYPYGCVEQTVSRSLGALVHADSSNQQKEQDQKTQDQKEQDKNKSTSQNKENKDKKIVSDKDIVNNGLALISEKQKADGSFSLWNDANEKGDVWVTAYTVDFLLRAKEKKFAVPEFTLENGLKWLSKVVESMGDPKDDALINMSYALYVLSKADKVETGSLRYFYDSYYAKIQSAMARAMVASSLALSGDLNRAKDGFDSVFEIDEEIVVYAPYGTALSENAGVLTLAQESLQSVPTLNVSDTLNSLKEALSNGLKNNTRLSTQEEAWVLLASNALVGVNPPTAFEVMVNGNKVSSNTGSLSLPLTGKLAGGGVEIQNPGKDPLWQQVRASGIPKERKAESKGFEIERHYYGLDGSEVTPSTVKVGSEFVVMIKGKALDQSPHQMLVVDMLPAGFELQNSALPVTAGSQFEWLKNVSETTHTELRDDRYLAFIDMDGTKPEFTLAYLVRAVSLGKYVHPGVFVEDMYDPQYFARTEESQLDIVNP